MLRETLIRMLENTESVTVCLFFGSIFSIISMAISDIKRKLRELYG